MIVNIAGLQECGGKFGFVGGVGEELRLQTETVIGAIDSAVLAYAAFSQTVGGEELQTG